jgi:nucleoside-diphosphate-sugar epimerase
MKIFVAGATGALGRQLVPHLVGRGHDVIGMTRDAAKQDLVRSLGARPAVADALDPDAVAQAVASAEPEVIVHQLTALSGKFDLRHFDRFAHMTNRLRTEGTDHLLAAAQAVGARRFVAQSNAAWRAYSGAPVKDEDAPFDADPVEKLRDTLAAIRHLEEAVTGADWLEGVALRYGAFYGPGTGLSAEPGAEFSDAIRKRQFPLVGDGGGIWSFIHIDDAATATVEAIENGARGIYNVVDDEPAPVREWMPELARALGAKPPRRVPRWVGRLLAGELATAMMTELRGATNEKAKRELAWKPSYPSWRQGFAQGLG